MSTLIFHTLESSNCSTTYQAIYGVSCSSVAAGSVGSPLIYLSESPIGTNTFTPSFTVENIAIKNISYSV